MSRQNPGRNSCLSTSVVLVPNLRPVVIVMVTHDEQASVTASVYDISLTGLVVWLLLLWRTYCWLTENLMNCDLEPDMGVGVGGVRGQR